MGVIDGGCSLRYVNDRLGSPLAACDEAMAYYDENTKRVAPDRFPAHALVKSNLYGGSEVDGERVSKGTERSSTSGP